MITQPMTPEDLERLKLEKLKLLQAKQEQRKLLPHRNSLKFYAWQRDFLETTNRICLLTAANQIGKSSVQIIRNIEWATNKDLWPILWPDLIARGDQPRVAWYMYPSKEVATLEWETKWRPLMPRDQEHPEYGWTEKYKNGYIESITFRTGITIVFKVYAQDAQKLQSATCAWISCDEELPFSLYDEIIFRISATKGYFSMVFTATLGQDEWRQAMEPKEGEEERFPTAWKRSISLYDCQVFEDGTPSQWTDDEIKARIDLCGTHNEVLRRIWGRFVVSEGRVYPSFDSVAHKKDPHPVPPKWKIYVGIDSGSGGDNDPAAIVFVAVNPEYTQGRVIKAWRGDKIITTSGDIVKKYIEMKGDLPISGVFYDYADKDLHTLASRMSIGFSRADKSRTAGINIVNSLFKNNMLYLYAHGDILKLSHELSSLMHGRKNAMDHLCDALRYVCKKIPWDFSVVGKVIEKEPEPPKLPTSMELRRGDRRLLEEPRREYTIDEEIDEANALYGA